MKSISPQNGEGYYGKAESQMIAGIAILLMIWHHLFSYPNWLIDGISVDSVLGKYVNYIVWLTARIGNICIYIFAFQSGYSIYQRSDLYDTARKRVARIFSFLFSYWLVCIFFWVIGWLFNEKLPTPSAAILNMFGLEVGFYTDWMNVCFAWYVLYYILLVAAYPILNRCFRAKSPLLVSLSAIGCLCVLLALSYYGVVGYWTPFAASLMGIFTSKYRLFEYLNNALNKYFKRIWFCLLILGAIILVRIMLLYISFHFYYNSLFAVFASVCEGLIAFALIFALISLMNNICKPWLSRILCFFGGISMFLWFLHSILFTGSRFLQPYIYFSGEPIVIFLTTLLVFVPIAIMFRLFTKSLRRLNF